MERRGHNLPLDDLTAERLVTGAVAPGDAPPGYAPVARLLTDARSHLPVTALDDELLGLLVAAVQVRPAGRTKLTRALTARVGAVAAVALLSTAGAAAAATGKLPGPAQDAVAGVVERIGIDLPTNADDELDPADAVDTGDVADGEGTGTEDGIETGDEAGDDGGSGPDAKPATGHADNPTAADAHGAAVSDVARTTETTGRDKGAEVSGTARAGHGPDGTATDGTATGADEDSDEGVDEPGRPADAGAHAPSGAPDAGGDGGRADTVSTTGAGGQRAPGPGGKPGAP